MTELFDTYSKSYRDVVQSSIDFSGLPYDFFTQAKANLLRDVVAAHFGADARPMLLDVGCGVGSLHPFVQDFCARLCGVDVSEECIAQARASNPAVEYKAYKGLLLPHDDDEFDVVFAACVMHHVAPADWLAFLHEARRVVRPGGLVCIVEHNPFNPLTRLAVRRCPFDADAVLLRAAKTRQLLHDAGLCNVDSDYFLLLPSGAPLARRVERLFSTLPFGAQYMAFGEVPRGASERHRVAKPCRDASRTAA
jgi:2-polyprenyl-3-methyl-5-hydroxy-6-metoxy-1,4-benzoquinol methylase